MSGQVIVVAWYWFRASFARDWISYLTIVLLVLLGAPNLTTEFS